MGNLDSISIMKKRNLGINEANRRFQHPRPAAEFEDNQKKFIQVSSYTQRMLENLKKNNFDVTNQGPLKIWTEHSTLISENLKI